MTLILPRVLLVLFVAAPRIVHAQPTASQDLSVGGNIRLQGFLIRPGMVLEVPNQIRFQRGGVSDPLPPHNGRVRAQPGGNLEIQPLGDYYRSALDIYPTQGKRPDTDALAELTIHRLFPSNQGHEMLSISGLADSQNRFGVIVEAHGAGRVKPLDFQMIQGGLLAVDKHVEPFDAIAMRIKTDGTMQFGVSRNGGAPGPVDAISLERDYNRATGSFPSDSIRLTAKRIKLQPKPSDWRVNVQLPGEQGSAFTFENREPGQEYQKKLEIHSSGDVEVLAPGAGVILSSPNGRKWRVGVSDEGALEVKSAL